MNELKLNEIKRYMKMTKLLHVHFLKGVLGRRINGGAFNIQGGLLKA